MNIVLASAFRDASSYLDRYLDQCEHLYKLVTGTGHAIRFVWGENDSTDDTADRLRMFHDPAHGVTVIDCSTGAPYYLSREVHSERWANVAAYSNPILAQLTDDDDILLWVECDLIWEPPVLLAIAEQAVTLGVVAAPVWRGDRFYDSWGTQRDNEPFLPPRGAGLIHVDSCAGAIAIRGDIAQSTPVPVEDACRGWTENMGGVWLDTNVSVEHP